MRLRLTTGRLMVCVCVCVLSVLFPWRRGDSNRASGRSSVGDPDTGDDTRSVASAKVSQLLLGHPGTSSGARDNGQSSERSDVTELER